MTLKYYLKPETIERMTRETKALIDLHELQDHPLGTEILRLSRAARAENPELNIDQYGSPHGNLIYAVMPYLAQALGEIKLKAQFTKRMRQGMFLLNSRR